MADDEEDRLPTDHTTRWEQVYWRCPECDSGELFPLDSRDLDPDVDPSEHPGYSRAISATEPVVVCANCGAVFDVAFERRDG